jgi:hypothetical protein
MFTFELLKDNTKYSLQIEIRVKVKALMDGQDNNHDC